MFRLWGKIWKSNHLVTDTVACDDDSSANRTRKVLHGLETICHELDLPVPIWLDQNIAEFQRVSKTRFRQDSFIEEVPFDYLEIQVIEEDLQD